MDTEKQSPKCRKCGVPKPPVALDQGLCFKCRDQVDNIRNCDECGTPTPALILNMNNGKCEECQKSKFLSVYGYKRKKTSIGSNTNPLRIIAGTILIPVIFLFMCSEEGPSTTETVSHHQERGIFDRAKKSTIYNTRPATSASSACKEAHRQEQKALANYDRLPSYQKTELQRTLLLSLTMNVSMECQGD